MNLIDKQDVILAQIGEDGSQITRTFDSRASRDLEIHIHLIGDYMGDGGFTQTRRAVQQDMIEAILAFPRCLNKNLQVVANFVLPVQFVEPLDS